MVWDRIHVWYTFTININHSCIGKSTLRRPMDPSWEMGIESLMRTAFLFQLRSCDR